MNQFTTQPADEKLSLIERAARQMPGSLFAPPPVAGDLPPAPMAPAAAPSASAVPAASAPAASAPAAGAALTASIARRLAEQPGPQAVIDRDRLAQAQIMLPESSGTALLEEFRIVKRQLLVQSADLRRRGGGGAAQRVMISSPHPAEGKTFCALNLAMSIAAEKDSEVLLVDLDLARHSVLEILGLPQEPGLMDALADPAIDVRDCVIRTDIPGLSVLPGGKPTLSDAEYLASARAAQVLDQLTEGAPRRIVVIDTPPVLAASLPVEVAKLVGQIVMVVMTDKTSGGAIRDAAQLLAGCPNIQLLLNAVHFSPSGRRFGSYYGYRG